MQPLHFISAHLPQGKQTSHDHTPCLHKFMNHSVHMDYELPMHYYSVLSEGLYNTF